MIEVEM